MRKISFYSIYFLLLLPGMLLALTPAQELLQSLNQIKTLKANFKQTLVSSTQVGTEHYEGNVMILKPNQFYWHVLKPSEEVIVGDGEKLWVYDVDLAQVTVRDFDKAVGNTPARLLSGQLQNLEQHFHVVKKGDQHYFLTPKAKDDMIKQLTLILKNDTIKKMIIIDGMQQKSTLQFYKVQKNITLSSQVFKFIPPNGVDVLHQ